MSAQPRVAIVDHSLGNLFSVLQACTHVGLNAAITADGDDVIKADAVIVPGVGAYKDAMRTLHERGLVEPLRSFAGSGKPLIGICLGMQLLMEHSEEFGHHKGLGLIKGEVVRFGSRQEATAGPRLKVPQIGWNQLLEPANGWNGTLLEPLKEGAFMYFLHSYYVLPRDPEVVLAETTYAGIRYCSALRCENVWGFQFHPERSGTAGLRIYESLATSLLQLR